MANLANIVQTYVPGWGLNLTLKTKQVTAKLPTLEWCLADFGNTAEKALSNLRELATGLIEILLD